MEEKLNFNFLLVFKQWESNKWVLDKYFNIDLMSSGIASVGDYIYSKEENKYLLNNKISECPPNCNNKPLLVYISKDFTKSEVFDLYRKLISDVHSEALYTYDEIKNTFVNPYIEDTKEKSSENYRYARYWDDYINSSKISNVDKKMIKTNIFMVFQHNLITGEPFILKDFTECDLAKFISSPSDKYKKICNRYIERSTIEQLLSEHTCLDLESDDENEYMYAYLDKEMLLEEKESFRASLSKAILSSKHFEVSEIQKICGITPIKENFQSIEKNYENKIIKEKVVKKKNNKVVDGLTEGVILNNKNYITDPAVGRESEIENLIVSLAQKRKCPILVGESGVGKTTIVDELVYMIENNNVPSFLKDRVIVEVSTGNLIAGTKYRGDLEEKLKHLFEIAESKDIVLFIDEIHLMYDNGCGADKAGAVDMAYILRNHIDRFGLKVIGATTNEEYNKYFANDSLKRRFDKINVKEPDNTILNMIIMSTFESLSKEDNISSDELLHNFPNIITNLIELTDKRHRVHNDIENNPSLVIGIIEKAYAYAKAYDKGTLEIDHLIKGITSCEKLYEVAKKEGIQRILDDEPIEEEIHKCKIIQFNS